MGRYSLAAAFVFLINGLGSTAWAQEEPSPPTNRPTSGDMSIVSGRTLGNGETALAAGLGWPGLWAEVVFAPSSVLNIGARGAVLIGSPVMGLGRTVGGSLTVPTRYHFLGKGVLDLSILIEPGFAIGQGSIAGQEGIFSDELGFAATLTMGALAGAQLSDSITFTLGLAGEMAYVDVSSGVDTAQFVGGGIAILGLELNMSRDTMLFAEGRGGIGFAPDDVFDGHGIVRVSLGMAYLL